MGVVGEDGGEIFQGGLTMQFLYKNRQKTEIFNNKNMFIDKIVFLC